MPRLTVARASALLIAVAGAASPWALAWSQPAGHAPVVWSTPEAVSPRSVQPAPPGYVGRTTTDTLISYATIGSENRARRATVTVGSIVKICPKVGMDENNGAPKGTVEGVFSLALNVDEAVAESEGVETPPPTHFSQSMSGNLTGYVGDGGALEYVSYTLTFNRTDGEVRSETVVQRDKFVPGPLGGADVDAMLRSVEKTAELAFAAAIALISPYYKAAEAAWNDPESHCVQFTFDPPTETESLGPEEEQEVTITLRTKEFGDIAPFRGEVGTQGNGSVTPREVVATLEEPAKVTYKASRQPRRGHGLNLAVRSLAGAAVGEWKITDGTRYEGTFTQVSKAEGFAGFSKGQLFENVRGRLVWKRDEAGTPTFGDTPSVFYKATEGELDVRFDSNSTGLQGSNCETTGGHSVPLTSIAESARKFLSLEIAGDGRYRLVLGIADYPQTTWEIETVCNFPGTGTNRQKVTAMRPAIVLGVHEGTLAEDGSIVGEAMPIRSGYQVTTGDWSFKKVDR